MIKIEIKSAEVYSKSGISKKSGKPYTIREQDAWAFVSDREGKPQPYPARIRLHLFDDQQPYPAGVYQLVPASITVDRFSSLSISPVLVPLAASAATATRAAA